MLKSSKYILQIERLKVSCWNIGTQVKLYFPAPFLHAGDNEIIVFEEKESAPERNLKFEDVPILQN